MARRLTGLLAVATLLFAAGCDNQPGAVKGDTTGDANVVSPSPAARIYVAGLELPAGANAVVSLQTNTTASSGAARGLAAQDAPNVVIDTAVLVLGEIQLNLADDDPNDVSDDPNDMSDDPNDMEDDGDSVKLVGPFLVDLVNGTSENLGLSNIDNDADDDGVTNVNDDDDDGDGTNDDADDDDDNDGVPDDDDQDVDSSKIFDAMQLPPGVYKHIKFRMRRLDAEAVGMPGHDMDGLSARVTGTIDGVPFEYRTRFNEQFKFSSQMGIEVVDGEIATFLLTLDVARWFADLEYSDDMLEDDGSLLIDASENNSGLANDVRRNIKSSSHFGPHYVEDELDDDGDDGADDGNDDDGNDDDGSDDGSDDDPNDVMP